MKIVKAYAVINDNDIKEFFVNAMECYAPNDNIPMLFDRKGFDEYNQTTKQRFYSIEYKGYVLVYTL